MPANLEIIPDTFSFSLFNTKQNLSFAYLLLIVENSQRPIEKFSTLFNKKLIKKDKLTSTLNNFKYKNSLFSS